MAGGAGNHPHLCGAGRIRSILAGTLSLWPPRMALAFANVPEGTTDPGVGTRSSTTENLPKIINPANLVFKTKFAGLTHT